MRKLNLKDYTSYDKVPDPMNPGTLLKIECPYPAKDTMVMILFAPAQRLTGLELIKQQALALKLEACKEDTILLEEAEWDRLKTAFDKFQGFGRNDVELVERVNNAEVVEVEQK